MINLFYESNRWFAFEAPIIRCIPCNLTQQDQCQNKTHFRRSRYVCECAAMEYDDEDAFLRAKAEALPVLNPEILERFTLETCPIVDSRVPILAWPGTIEKISKHDMLASKDEGYVLHLPNSADSYTEGAEVHGFTNTLLAENESLKQLLEEYKEVIKELLPLTLDYMLITMDAIAYNHARRTFNRAKSLIETTSKPQKQ